MEKITSVQAAKLLGIAIDNLVLLEKQGIIHSIRNRDGTSSYSSEEIKQIKSRHSLTLAEEAAQIDTGIQRELSSAAKSTRKVFIIVGIVLLGAVLLVVLFTVLFMVSPLQTAKFLGL